MATSSHPPFPSRPYTANLSTRQPYAQQTTTPYQPTPSFAPPQQPQQPIQQSYQPPAQQPPRTGPRPQQQQPPPPQQQQSATSALSPDQLDEINEAFTLFDLDKDGYIDYHELKVALKALGFDLPKTEILSLLQEGGIPATELHPTGKGKAPVQQQQTEPHFLGPSRLLLPQQSFVEIAAQRISVRDPAEEILRAFELFDVEGKGRIELEDLRRVARELGEGLQDEELVAMIEEFDVRGEGGIDRDAFLGICLGG